MKNEQQKPTTANTIGGRRIKNESVKRPNTTAEFVSRPGGVNRPFTVNT
jgi:hypothetical protein